MLWASIFVHRAFARACGLALGGREGRIFYRRRGGDGERSPAAGCGHVARRWPGAASVGERASCVIPGSEHRTSRVRGGRTVR